MGNKRNRAPPNKKSNNWKVIQNIKKRKNSNKSEQSDHDDIEFQERRENESEVKENDSECGNDSMKRRRMCDSTEYLTIYPELSSYYALLSNDDDNSNNPEDNSNGQGVDPLSCDQSHNEDDVPVRDDDQENNYEIDNNENIDSEESHIQSSDEEEVNDKEKLSGRRLFDVSDLFEKIQKIGRHSKHCTFEDMICVSETKKGFNSLFKFRCEKCGVFRKLESCPKKPLQLTVNQEAVLGISSIGSGFYHLQEFSSQISVPCIGASLYDKISKDQQSDWFTLAKQSALEALREEIALARANNDVDENGNALITIICDGGWGKRSYGKNFNSLSGCAVLIGQRTKKVIFFGVRNKYCHICKIAESNNTTVREHQCNNNYNGPSSGMEAEIVLEGFQSSEKSQARFYKLIADGDSSVYKTLRDVRVYKNPDLVIIKIECVNHLCRNFRSKFGNLATVTKFDSKLRKQITKTKANNICKGVKSAAKHWREADVTLSEKIRNLENDVMNSPSHYFGVHTKCKDYFCDKATDQKAIDNLNELKKDGLYYEVLNLCQIYFAGNATSLLENETNNPAEEFNNVVAKFLGGKRINYSLSKSYSARVAMAVVQCNTEGHAASSFRIFKLGENHKPSTEKLELSRRRKLKANVVALQRKPRSRHTIQALKTGAYYHGDGVEDVDMPPLKFQNCKNILLKKLEDRQKNWKQIERATIDQRYNAFWHEMRQDMVPSNHFHKIVKAKKRDSYKGILKELMYTRSEFGSNAQIKHERLHERHALESFKNEIDETIEECGLFIDKKLSFLCASPFRLCGNNHLLHIKCPLKEFGKRFEDVAPKMHFFKNDSGSLSINEKSAWFIEIQGEMRVTGRDYTYLMIWLGENQYRIFEVARNDNFFEETIEPEVTFFFMEAMLKELVDSRVGRHMEMRVYDSNISTFV